MALALLLTLAAPLATGSDRLFELQGKVYLPSTYSRRIAMVRLTSSNSPFFKNTMLFNHANFHFKKLTPGSYILAAWVRGYGLYERSIEVGPGGADAKSHVTFDLRLDQNPGRQLPVGTGMFVSVRQLSIPQKAYEESAKAYRAFGKRDEAGGIEHLEKAIALAPQFAEALNTLGTVYAHRGDVAAAEQYFRESLKQNPRQFDATMNLGGMLLTRHNTGEAMSLTQKALQMRPEDVLALTQLGWVYLDMNRVDEALDAFLHAKRIDADHAVRPQLGLIEVYRRRGDKQRERDEIADYIRRHPDDPEASRERARLEELSRELH